VKFPFFDGWWWFVGGFGVCGSGRWWC